MELVDGLCIAQVAMKEDVETAQGSFRDLRNAGNELLRRCVSLRSEGGVATNLGKDRSYALGYGQGRPTKIDTRQANLVT